MGTFNVKKNKKIMKEKTDLYWQVLAEKHGYESELEMWKQLHIKQQRTISETALKLGFSCHVVRYRMNKLKIKIRRRGTISNETIRKIRDLRLKGYKQDTVSKKLGVSTTAVTEHQFNRTRGKYGSI